jgi:RNA polymerase sigma-70 factor, ECF subfamily
MSPNSGPDIPQKTLRLVSTAAEAAKPDRSTEEANPRRGKAIDRVLGGDTDAFELLYRAYGAEVYAVCLRMSGDSTSAQELVQDVFVRAWERLGSFRGQSAFGTWLHRLAVNVVLEHFRGEQRRDRRVTFQSNLEQLNAAASSGSFDDRLDLESSLLRLPAAARIAFVLYHVEGYSHGEIAKLTGLAAGTIRAQVFRARQILMGMLS